MSSYRLTSNSTPHLGVGVELGSRKWYQSKCRPHIPIRLLYAQYGGLSCTVCPQCTTRQTDDRHRPSDRNRPLCYSIGGIKIMSATRYYGVQLFQKVVDCDNVNNFAPLNWKTVNEYKEFNDSIWRVYIGQTFLYIHHLNSFTVTILKQGHHHNGNQAARRPAVMCSICGRRFTTR